MILVVIESPFGTRPDGSRASPEEVERNKVYVQRCLRDSLDRGEAPFASHALYTTCLKDATPAERKTGMQAGFAMGDACQMCAVYEDYGLSPGMYEGIARAESRLYQAIEFRRIGLNPEGA